MSTIVIYDGANVLEVLPGATFSNGIIDWVDDRRIKGVSASLDVLQLTELDYTNYTDCYEETQLDAGPPVLTEWGLKASVVSDIEDEITAVNYTTLQSGT